MTALKYTLYVVVSALLGIYFGLLPFSPYSGEAVPSVSTYVYFGSSLLLVVSFCVLGYYIYYESKCKEFSERELAAKAEKVQAYASIFCLFFTAFIATLLISGGKIVKVDEENIYVSVSSNEIVPYSPSKIYFGKYVKVFENTSGELSIALKDVKPNESLLDPFNPVENSTQTAKFKFSWDENFVLKNTLDDYKDLTESLLKSYLGGAYKGNVSASHAEAVVCAKLQHEGARFSRCPLTVSELAIVD